MPEIAENIIIIFNTRMRTTLGRAWTHYGPHQMHNSPKYVQELNGRPTGGLICFNVELYYRATDEQRRKNMIHELAHILANLRHNRDEKPGKERSVGHGSAWKAMMRELGEEPVRCHDVDTCDVKRKQTRYQMLCPKRCGWSFTFAKARRTRRINEARKGKTRRCPRCRAQIRLEHWEATKEV
jgi:predicted SprT family Zn-dependent metalloprotease